MASESPPSTNSRAHRNSAQTLCIVNPAAGHETLAQWEAFKATLVPWFPLEEVVSSRPGEATELARRAASHYRIIVAVGGDGTVYEVLNGVLTQSRGRPLLGIVPLGTGNDSAAGIGIRTASEAREALLGGTPRPIDVLEIQCRSGGAPLTCYALLFASVGITSELLRKTTPRLKATLGQRLAYLAGLLLALRKHKAGMMKIAWDGSPKAQESRFILVCASNGETFGGGIRIAPGARMDDGQANVNLITAVSRWEAIRHLRRLYMGNHTSHPKVQYALTSTLAIETEPPVEVAADGDLIGFTPARVTVRRGAVHFLAGGMLESGESKSGSGAIRTEVASRV